MYVYILKSRKTGRYYTGSSADPEERLRAYNRGKTRSLKNQGPFEIVHIEQYDTITAARKRENQIKRYKGGRPFQDLIQRAMSPSSSPA